MYFRWLSKVVCLLCVVGSSRAEDVPTQKAKAALALAEAQRLREKLVSAPKERAKVVETDPSGCFDDLDIARSVSKTLKKPLVLYVGMTCKDVPEVDKALGDDVVKVHLKAYNNNPNPRIVFPDPKGVEFTVPLKSVDGTTPVGIRNRMGLSISDRLKQELLEVYRQQELRSAVSPYYFPTPASYYAAPYSSGALGGTIGVGYGGTNCST